jgi:hypothetical protein
MFILGFKLVTYVLNVLSWSLKFRKFELVGPFLIIFIELANTNLKNLRNQLQTFKNLRDQLQNYKS